MPEIVSGKAVNNSGSRPVRDHSRFDNSHPVAGTYRFGEYGVHFSADVVPDDNHVLRCKHVVRSYTLKAPMLQGLKYRKDYFLVPLSAILPLNYEKLVVSPNIGEDIDPTLVGTSVTGLTDVIQNFLSASYQAFTTQLVHDEDFTKDTLGFYIKLLLVADMLIGSGSLPSSMDCHLTSHQFATQFDSAFDKFFSRLFNYEFAEDGHDCNMTIKIGDVTYDVNTSNAGDIQIENYHELMSMLRDGFDWEITSMSGTPFSESGIGFGEYGFDPSTFIVGDAVAPIDLAKFFAYQIICAHFFSNDHVDYIYSAELYRQNLQALILNVFDSTGTAIDSENFSWNGVNYRYDSCSADYFLNVVNSIQGYDFDSSELFFYVFDYLRLIFGYNRSLRFQDYFTGSRTRPLAVGDAGVAVNDGYVNVVDTMQKRWYIKLWNQVNRVGRKLSSQMKGLFPDVQTSTDWHDPIWLASTSDYVNAQEVDNTGAAQIGEDRVDIPVTSSFIDRAEKYAFNIDINDRYGVILGITSFDIQRFYSDTIERTFFHVDRYDKFNSFLQFTGDQKVYQKELYSSSSFNQIFGYQGKYMEYKQRYPYAFGGFINNALPGMIFLADEGRSQYTIEHIGPNYIRSYPAELDRFYDSLTGYSLGTYFHFFILNTNELDSNRPMAYNPQLD